MARRHPRIPFAPVVRYGVRKYCPGMVVGRRDDWPSEIIESLKGTIKVSETLIDLK